MAKLKAADKTGCAVSGLILALALARLGLFIMIFLNFSAAYAICTTTKKEYLGFLIVAGFYILLAILIVVFSEKINNDARYKFIAEKI